MKEEKIKGKRASGTT